MNGRNKENPPKIRSKAKYKMCARNRKTDQNE